MKINKVSNKYLLFKEDSEYIIDFGNVKAYEDKSVTLEVTNIEEASLVTIHPTCGCTSQDRKLVNKNTLQVVLRYNDCVGEFTKAVGVQYAGKRMETIILKGRCQ